jgi:hypothetical protein
VAIAYYRFPLVKAEGEPMPIESITPRLFMFRFTIKLHAISNGLTAMEFKQVFTSISDEGNRFLKRYEDEDFKERSKNLEKFMNQHLEIKRRSGIGG